MIQILKVTGESLSPFFQRGDYVVILKPPFFLRQLKAGDFVVFRHPGYGTLIKMIQSLSSDGEEIFVVGAHPESADSREFGPIPRRWLTGKVVIRISNPTFQL
jgi:signal peptidase I